MTRITYGYAKGGKELDDIKERIRVKAKELHAKEAAESTVISGASSGTFGSVVLSIFLWTGCLREGFSGRKVNIFSGRGGLPDNAQGTGRM